MSTNRSATMLLELAGPELLPSLIARRRELVRRVVAAPATVYPNLADAVVRSGDEDVQLALAENPSFAIKFPEQAARLAGTGHPLIGTALIRHAIEPVSTAVMAAADATDPRWRGPGGLLHEIGSWYAWLGPIAGKGPFPEVDRAVFDRHCPLDAQLAALVGMWRRSGRDEAAGRLGDERLDPLVAEWLREAVSATDGLAVLTRAVEWLADADASVPLLRAVDRRAYTFRPEHPIDWPAALAAHDEQPFGDAVRALAVRPDCPDSFLLDLLAAGTRVLSWRPRGGRLPFYRAAAMTIAKRRDFSTAVSDLADALGAALDDGRVTAAQVVDQLTPVSVLAHAAVRAPDRLAPEVAARIDKTIGGDPGGWRALWQRIDDPAATLPQLLTAAAAHAASTAPGWPDWRRPEPIPAPDRKPGLRGPRRTMRDLIECLPTAVRLRILPALDGRGVFDVLTRCTPDQEFVTGVIDSGEPEHAALLAANHQLPAESVEPLLALDLPAVNARLYQKAPRWSMQRRIAAGLHHDEPGPGRSDFLPMHDTLRMHLFSLTERKDLVQLVETGVSEIAAHVLRHTRVPTGLLQLRLLLAVARRETPAAARALLDLDLTARQYKAAPWLATVRKQAAAALAREPETEAVRALQERVTEWSTPVRWIERLRRVDPDAGDLRILDAEQFTTDWAMFRAEHARQRFHPNLVRYLSDLPGFPVELAPPAEPDPADPVSTLAELVIETRPASTALSFAADAWRQFPDNPLPALCAETLGDNTEAWLLALDLVDDFPGTVAELLATARSAAQPSA